MRWPVFGIAAYLLLALQVGLAKHVAIPLPEPLGPIEPRIMLLLAVFVALAAPTSTTLIACGILGFLLDLTSSHTVLLFDSQGVVTGTMQAVLIGPYTLGYMAGGYFVVQMRPMLFRQHPLTIATMMIIAGICVHLVVLSIYTVRRFYEPMAGFDATTLLGSHGLSLLYSAVVGLVLAYPLTRLQSWFGFLPSKSARL